MTATAMVAEMRSDCQAHSTFSIPTNGLNQDVVPMACLATKKALKQVERVASIASILTLSINQYQYITKHSYTHRKHLLPANESFYLEGFWNDRALYDDIRKLKEAILGGFE